MREIVFDTETTGLSPLDRRPDGRDRLRRDCSTGSRPAAPSTPISIPDRPMPSEAEAVHGLSDAFLSDKPRFHDACEELLEFLGDCPLVAHNAELRFRLPQSRARPVRPAAGLPDADGRHARPRPATASRRQAQPRRAVHPLRRRPQPADQARRAARRAIARPSLCRADRRPPDRPRPRRYRRRADRGRRDAVDGRSASSRPTSRSAPPRPHAPDRGGARAPRRLPRRRSPIRSGTALVRAAVDAAAAARA